jgi:hypothetical protein
MSKRRGGSRVQTNLRVKAGTLDRLDAACDDLGCSRNQLITMFVEVGLDSHESHKAVTQLKPVRPHQTTGPEASPWPEPEAKPEEEGDHLVVHAAPTPPPQSPWPSDLGGELDMAGNVIRNKRVEVTEQDQETGLRASFERAVMESIEDSAKAEEASLYAAALQSQVAEEGDEPPHIHNWTPVLGQRLVVAGKVLGSFVCECGEAKVDIVH